MERTHAMRSSGGGVVASSAPAVSAHGTTSAARPSGPLVVPHPAEVRILIVYFSGTGLSRRVAEELRTLLGPARCDIEVVTELHPRKDGMLRRAFDALTRNTPAVHPRALHPWRYDLVIVGGPVHACTAAAPLRSFVRGLALQGSDVALFLVGPRRPRMRAFADLQQHFSRAPLARLWVPAADVLDGLHTPRLRSFCATLRGALEVIGTRNTTAKRPHRIISGNNACAR